MSPPTLGGGGDVVRNVFRFVTSAATKPASADGSSQRLLAFEQCRMGVIEAAVKRMRCEVAQSSYAHGNTPLSGVAGGR